MSAKSFQATFDQLEGGCTELTLHNFGEPLLNRELPPMIAYAKLRGCTFATLSTNATLLDDWWCNELTGCGLDQILVCVDGLTQATYGQYRIGGNLADVESNIRLLVERVAANGSALEIVIQFIVFRHNEHELGRVWDYASELGVHKLSVKLSASAARTDEFRPRDDAFVASNRAERRSGPLCHWVFDKMVINCDGQIMPCCWAGHQEQYAMGNIHRQTVSDVWHGEKYQTLRESVENRRDLWPLCEKKCLAGTHSEHSLISVGTGQT